MKLRKQILPILLVLIFSLYTSAVPVYSYGEVPTDEEITLVSATTSEPEFSSWQSNWSAQAYAQTGNVTLTPGGNPACLNVSWYSTQAPGTPAVCISEKEDFSSSQVITGTAAAIARSNGFFSYTASNRVCVTDFLEKDTMYYYRVTNDYNAPLVSWSEAYTFETRNPDDFQALVISDVQVGASGSIDVDTYNWNKTLLQAEKTAPQAAFLLSAGDNVNQKTKADTVMREQEYAGFLYPSLLRRLPVATAIGNHDTKVSDYSEHFNNPNSEKNYGKTPAGSDYYFRYGNALFIVLNTNSRAISAHRTLMQEAVAKNTDAVWRIVVMHHDIYGSGAAHSNRTSANMRTVFAPLMDEFQIDLALTGHDHSYSRSYPLLDGTAFTDYGTAQTNPVGTTYVSLGTASGCKMYSLSEPRQYYVAERSNTTVPTYSVLHVTSQSLALETYDYTGCPYADTLRIDKTTKKTNPLSFFPKAIAKKNTTYTKKSYKKLIHALSEFVLSFDKTGEDAGAAKIETYYKKKKDPLSYYGYAAGTSEALPFGFSSLLDKTLYLGGCSMSGSDFLKKASAVKTAVSGLEKTALTIKKGAREIRRNQTLKIKAGSNVQLKIEKIPAKNKITFSSASKKYVRINKNGVIKVLKNRKKRVKIKAKFENRTLVFYVKTIS